MRSTFEVHRVFVLEDRGLFAVTGEIGDGMVQTGMLAYVETADGTPSPFRERIHGVEYLELPEVEGRPALTFHCRDRVKLRGWMDLDLQGSVLQVSP